jgi:hypothetical protein
MGASLHDEPGAVAREAGPLRRGRTMLAETYGWFTEGFDTADLKEAKSAATPTANLRRIRTPVSRHGITPRLLFILHNERLCRTIII